MWSERHPLNQQLIPLILGFFLVFWAATSLTWYTQLRRMRIFSLEASASHLAAPLFDAARRKLDGLVFAQWQLDSLHTWLKVRVARLMPALPETGVNIEALLLVDAQGRILFSSQEETAAGVAPRPLSNVVST